MPVWDIAEINDDLILIMGDGSYSDGIYKFNLSDHQFEVIEFCLEPHFLLRNTYWYVGFKYGLAKSNNGIDWTSIDFFNDKECIAMDFYKDHIVVFASSIESGGGIYYSYDNGENWNSSAESRFIDDFRFDDNGKLFGVCESLGLLSSNDFGETWEVEFYSTNLSSVGYTDGKIFVAWYKPDNDKEGVAIWNYETKKLIFLNDGLLNMNINNLIENQIIDCHNIIACTEEGAYLRYDFSVDVDDDLLIPNYELTNYPNPFNPETTISYGLPNDSKVELVIYNIKGRKVKKLVSGNQEAGYHKVTWNGKDESGRSVASGVYFYQLRTDKKSINKKMIMMK